MVRSIGGMSDHELIEGKRFGRTRVIGILNGFIGRLEEKKWSHCGRSGPRVIFLFRSTGLARTNPRGLTRFVP